MKACARITAAVALAAAILFSKPAGAEKMPPLPEGAFTYAVIPDTQGYDGVGRHTKRGRAPGTGPVRNGAFTAIVDWIVANAAKENVKFVSHTGDIVDMNNDFQWAFASNIMARLDGVVPYGVAPGNHDMKASGDTSLFRKYFPASRFAGRPWYAGCFPGFKGPGFESSGDNANSCALFEGGGDKFVVLHLECNAPDPVLEWAGKMLEKHSDRHAIIATHQDLGMIDGKNSRKFSNDCQAMKAAGKNPEEYVPDMSLLGRMEWFKCHRGNGGNCGRAIWEKLTSRYANVFLAVSGDQGMVGVVRLDEKGVNGNTVHSVMHDCGGPLLRIYRFVPSERVVRCYTIDCGKGGELVHRAKYWKDDALFNFSMSYPGAAAGKPPAGKAAAETAKKPVCDPVIGQRELSWKGVPNVRDLGGLPGIGGKTVRRGLVFRSAGLNDNARYREKGTKKKLPKDQWVGPGKSRLDEETRKYLVETLGIKTDLDLRSDPEVFKMEGSPLGETVRWIRFSSANYGGMGKDQGREAFKKCFRVFLDRANYPIVFHCIAGADRTGSLACILNGLLGVEEDLLYRDWVYTWKRRNAMPSEKHWPSLMRVFAKYEGATLNDRIEAYVLSCGFSKEDIEKFRGIMLEQ